MKKTKSNSIFRFTISLKRPPNDTVQNRAIVNNNFTHCLYLSGHSLYSRTMPTSKSDYITTASQSYISRSASILAAPNLHSKGKSVIQKNVTIHGEFGASIHIGRYVYIDEDVEIAPSVIPALSDPLLTMGSGDSSSSSNFGYS